MASSLECLGLGVEDEDGFVALLEAVGPEARPFGRIGGVELLRWEDPSGARLILALKGRNVVDFLPSLACEHTTRLADIRAMSDEVAEADVVDDDGEMLTRLAIELEQRLLLANEPLEAAAAGIISFGREVSVHADAAAYHESAASFVGSDEARASHPGTRPVQWDTESFASFGLLEDEHSASAHLSGVVLRAERRTIEQTGQAFIVARVRTFQFETDVCLSTKEHPTAPEPGQIIAGTVVLVGSIAKLEQRSSGRSWWPRRSRS